MILVRPEVRETLSRWREPIIGAGLAGLGLWVATRGGWLLLPAGAVLAALGVGWALLGLRRMRFAGRGDAPGVVELDEGRISYLGPQVGGEISLSDLTEIRLLALRGRRVWRLRQSDGQALLVPVDATGSEALFDAFASLPGLSSADLVAALDGEVAPSGQTLPARDGKDRLVWRRQARGLTPV
jgi:hypothetical protein